MTVICVLGSCTASSIAAAISQSVRAMTQQTTDMDNALAKQTREIQNVVDQCRRAMVDLDVDAKALVVDQLHGWVELERSTHEQQH
jgi:hypothetical protein